MKLRFCTVVLLLASGVTSANEVSHDNSKQVLTIEVGGPHGAKYRTRVVASLDQMARAPKRIRATRLRNAADEDSDSVNGFVVEQIVRRNAVGLKIILDANLLEVGLQVRKISGVVELGKSMKIPLSEKYWCNLSLEPWLPKDLGFAVDEQDSPAVTPSTARLSKGKTIENEYCSFHGMHLYADLLVLNEQSRNVSCSMYGNSVIRLDSVRIDADSIECKQLFGEPKTRTLAASGDCVWRTEGKRINLIAGESLAMNRENQLQVTGRVCFEVEVEGLGLLDVRCDAVRVEEERFLVTGKVTAKSSDRSKGRRCD